MLHPAFIQFNHIGPCGDRWKGSDRHAAFCRDFLEAPLESLPSSVVLRARGKQVLGPLRDFLIGYFATVRAYPGEEFLVRSASQHPTSA